MCGGPAALHVVAGEVPALEAAPAQILGPGVGPGLGHHGALAPAADLPLVSRDNVQLFRCPSQLPPGTSWGKQWRFIVIMP